MNRFGPADRRPRRSSRRRRPSIVVAVVVDEPHLDARHRRRRRSPAGAGVGAHGGVHQRLGEPVALDDLLAGELLDARRTRGRAAAPSRRRAAGPASGRRRSPASASASRPSRWYIVGTPNSIVAPSLSASAAAAASKRPRWRSSPPRRSGPSSAEHEAVDVEERQAVGEHVLAGPLPGVGERVEVGGDRAAGEHRALGRPVVPRRVDDQRRVARRWLARRGQLGAAGVDVDRAARAARREVGAGAPTMTSGALSVSDVLELAAAELRVDRHERRRRRRARRRRRRTSRASIPPTPRRARAVELRRERGGRLAQLAVGERRGRRPRRPASPSSSCTPLNSSPLTSREASPRRP